MEHATVVKDPLGLSYTGSNDTDAVLVADGAARVADTANRKLATAVENFIAVINNYETGREPRIVRPRSFAIPCCHDSEMAYKFCRMVVKICASEESSREHGKRSGKCPKLVRQTNNM